MKIYFARHGQSLANTLHIVSNRDLPHPLTETGVQHARNLALTLRGIPFQQIFSSPILRARQTAEIVSAALATPLEIHPALAEYDCGELEGRGDDETWAAHRFYVQSWLAGTHRDEAPSGGETFYAIRQRMNDFLASLRVSYAETNANLLCISHGGTLLFGLPEALTNVDFPFASQHFLGHADLVIAEWRSNGWWCHQWGSERF